MAEDGKGTPQNPDGGNTPPKESDNMIPSYRLKEEADKRRELEARLAEIEEREKKRKEKELAEKGKYQELLAEKEKEMQSILSEKEQFKAEADKWHGYEAEKKNKLLERLPEAERSKLANLGLSELETIVELTSKSNPNDPKFRAGVAQAGNKYDGYPNRVEFARAMNQKGPEGRKRYLELKNEYESRGEPW